ncbi:MAG: hypothetical protein LBG60_17490 [Bifidobacteriaceae bacterium]|nr:hypothetical protein [Bifidobacteriaceae bacterium]
MRATSAGLARHPGIASADQPETRGAATTTLARRRGPPLNFAAYRCGNVAPHAGGVLVLARHTAAPKVGGLCQR